MLSYQFCNAPVIAQDGTQGSAIDRLTDPPPGRISDPPYLCRLLNFANLLVPRYSMENPKEQHYTYLNP